jgi:hypothetical protein
MSQDTWGGTLPRYLHRRSTCGARHARYGATAPPPGGTLSLLMLGRARNKAGQCSILCQTLVSVEA